MVTLGPTFPRISFLISFQVWVGRKRDLYLEGQRKQLWWFSEGLHLVKDKNWNEVTRMMLKSWFIPGLHSSASSLPPDCSPGWPTGIPASPPDTWWWVCGGCGCPARRFLKTLHKLFLYWPPPAPSYSDLWPTPALQADFLVPFPMKWWAFSFSYDLPTSSSTPSFLSAALKVCALSQVAHPMAPIGILLPWLNSD